jgi:hypothetical protein
VIISSRSNSCLTREKAKVIGGGPGGIMVTHSLSWFTLLKNDLL